MSRKPSPEPLATGQPRLRRLSDEEIELWVTVASSITRRPGASLPSPRPAPAAGGQDAPLVRARGEAVAFPEPPRRQAPLPPLAPLERRLKQKLSRGRMTADAAIDLHGLRQQEAYNALQTFLQRAQRDGSKVVLVVTGKGGRVGTGDVDPFLERGAGVLKRQVPLWLAMPDFRSLIIGYEEAGRAHGGAGALYVRLRRR